MGRKKQKVRWTTVEDGFFDSDNNQVLKNQQDFESEYNSVPSGMPQRHNSDSSVTSSHNGGYMRYRAKYPPRRPYWSNTPVPPRFERNNKHYPDPEIDSSCETEELPNGFTKIRSKNLDVLFRKDYYAQRTLSAATTSSSAVSSEQGEPPEDPEGTTSGLTTSGIPSEHVVPEEEEEDDEVSTLEESGVKPEGSESDTAPSTDKKAETNEKESSEKGTSSQTTTTKKSVINTNATPFYPASYVPIPPQMPPSNYIPPVSSAGVTGPRPNLFLYSPSSNTMIPCEEIIIPNAVVPGQDVYQGPSNIYLAFPMENGAGSTQTTPPPAPQQPATSMASCGSSTNSTPPQAQSPSSSATAFATANMVQYDQYGVPYTSYTPIIPSEGGSANESSSIESTAPHSPPDLSMYNPTNWVPAHSGDGHAYQTYQQYYPYYQTPYYNNYGVMMENSTVPSSAGESPNEDRSEGEEPASTPNTVTTTSSPKKENEKETEKFIPGLVINAKRPTKKRRKKKVNPEVQSSLSDQHRGSSSSEANVLQMATAKAITILKRDDSDVDQDVKNVANEAKNVSQIPVEVTEVTSEVSQLTSETSEVIIPEVAVCESVQETAEESAADLSCERSNLSVEVKEDGGEEVLVVSEESVEPVKPAVLLPVEPEVTEASLPVELVNPVTTTSNNRVRPNRRRRGARKNDKNKKSSDDDLVSVNSHEWEHVPKEIIEPDEGGWETVGKSRTKINNPTISSQQETIPEVIPEVVVTSTEVIASNQQQTSQLTEVIQNEPQIAKEDTISEVDEANILTSGDVIPQPQIQAVIDASSSAPASRKSTLKRPKKKRSSLDGTSTPTTSNVLSRPVLISDGDFDVASAAAALRAQKNAFEVLDEAKIKELQDKSGNNVVDTLYVSDIGHGMTSGPINLGRFGLGKYVPPDRSEEIYPIPMQQKDDEVSDKISEISETDAINEDKPLKSMLEEVLRNAAGNKAGITGNAAANVAKSSLTTYIRDAARFTELAPHSEEHCSVSGVPAPMGSPEVLINKTTTKTEDELDLD